MASLLPCKHILISGAPGVGKTTLIKKIANIITEKHSIKLNGFFTEELREGGTRRGFDVVEINGSKRAVLSRKSDFLPSATSKSFPMVGQYCVDVKSFESIALPTFDFNEKAQVFVIDEIGKMELFSTKFVAKVKNIFEVQNSVIIATVPIAKGKPIQLVEDIKRRSDCKLFMVTKTNRENLVDEICELIMTSQNTLTPSK